MGFGLRRTRFGRLLLTPAVFGLSIVTGAVAIAATGYSDVEPDHAHADGIAWVSDAGVTHGCGDGTTYCPEDSVTRAQMATFMQRLAGDAPGVSPSVDAATVLGMSPEELRGQQGPAGPQGSTGPAGPQGPQGPQGAPGVAGLEVVTASGDAAATDNTKFVSVSCPPGKVILGGGASTNSFQDWAVMDSRPANFVDGLATSWSVFYIKHGADSSLTATAYGICAAVG